MFTVNTTPDIKPFFSSNKCTESKVNLHYLCVRAGQEIADYLASRSITTAYIQQC